MTEKPRRGTSIQTGVAVPLDAARRIALEEYRRGELAGIALAFDAIIEDERRLWQPARAHGDKIIALMSAIRTAVLMLDLRADRTGTLAFMDAQAQALAAEAVALRNLLTAAGVQMDTTLLQRLISDVQDGVTAACAGNSLKLRALFDAPEWLEAVQKALSAAGPGPGARRGSVRLHSAWLRQQVLHLMNKNPSWSAGQIAIHLRAQLQAEEKASGLNETQAAALKTLKGKAANQTVRKIMRLHRLRSVKKLI